jgi:HSP20 family protein
MRLMRWEPFREMDDLLKGFGPVFDRMPALGRLAEGRYEFIPPADVIEREKEYLVKVDLPDVRKEDVKVLFDEGVLTIKGERKVEKETKGETVHRTERFYGMFERSFALPDDVDPKGIHAESKDGVLMVSLPRVAVQKPRPLAITIQ